MIYPVLLNEKKSFCLKIILPNPCNKKGSPKIRGAFAIRLP